ncbi:MAG: TatA/E family twin arginine-targeting protein translocase [Oscillatoriales cyanobacterium C42_A2020_001]|nr:TatA/E family twin arginine-targeting protein translocase [Leptolyngbyaceae cyanobacterium C42_A2020_001]
MNIFGIGLPEMALIFIIALLVFGPKKLPEIGRSLGKAIRGFQDASKEFENEFKREAEQLEKTIKQPMEAKLEEPEQPALSPASEVPAAQPTVVEAETVASSSDTSGEQSIQ